MKKIKILYFNFCFVFLTIRKFIKTKIVTNLVLSICMLGFISALVACSKDDGGGNNKNNPGSPDNPDYMTKIPDDLLTKNIPSGPVLDKNQKEHFLQFYIELMSEKDIPDAYDLIFPGIKESEKKYLLEKRQKYSNEKNKNIAAIENNCQLNLEISGDDIFNIPNEEFQVGKTYETKNDRKITGNSPCPLNYFQQLVSTRILLAHEKDESLGKDLKEFKNKINVKMDVNFLDSNFQKQTKVYQITADYKNVSIYRSGYASKKQDNGYDSYLKNHYDFTMGQASYNTLENGLVKINFSGESLAKSDAELMTMQKTLNITQFEMNGVLYVLVNKTEEKYDNKRNLISRVSKIYLNNEDISQSKLNPIINK